MTATPTAQIAAARVYQQEGFAWDQFDAYLFDVDGTLLRSRDRVHYDSFFNAVQSVLGQPLVLDGVVLHGNTDPGILRDAFRLARLDDVRWRGSNAAIFAHMTDHVQARRDDMELVVMPGVETTLAHLKAREARLGVATGNIESIGWIKVEVAGLREWFSFGGFSDGDPEGAPDGFEERAAMIANALRLARAEAGEHATVCVVGDTPADVRAARANGLPALAVATGNYSFDELMASHPEACATTLAALLPLGAGVAGSGPADPGDA